MRLNYHHLRYFQEVARQGHLTRAAEVLNLSQSALSTQIKQLEDRLGQKLFHRIGRKLALTEAGHIALRHADRIFGTGDALLATLAQYQQLAPPLRVGAQSTLSRNFQISFLAPVLAAAQPPLELRSGGARTLIAALRDLELDIVLATQPPETDAGDILSHKIAEQSVRLHGVPERLRAESLEELLADGTFVLPSESEIRTGFLALCQRYDVTPRIAAEVDDMAMVRLLAREGAGLAIAPEVVVADELKSGRLGSAPFELGISERFFALTLRRDYPHPALQGLLDAAALSG